MTNKELTRYLIKKCLEYLEKNECPPDGICKKLCLDSCNECWTDFLTNRYKNFKLEDRR